MDEGIQDKYVYLVQDIAGNALGGVTQTLNGARRLVMDLLSADTDSEPIVYRVKLDHLLDPTLEAEEQVDIGPA